MMKQSNPTEVQVVMTDNHKIKVYYPFANEIIGKFSLCCISDYMIEMKYAEEISKVYKKYLRAVMCGAVPETKGNIDNKFIRCVPCKKSGYMLMTRKDDKAIGLYKRHEKALFLQDATLNFELIKAVENYRKRIMKLYKEEKQMQDS